MKMTVSLAGKFSMGYLWAAYLERRGMLERLITPVPYRRGAQFGVSRERTRSLWPIGAVNWGMQHVAPSAVQPLNQIAVSASYDEAASRMMGDCDVFNGWASMSLRSLRAARRRGVPTVLQLASAHIVTQTALLVAEARRWGIDAPATHPAVIARTVREYEESDVLASPSEFVRRTFVEQGVDAAKVRVVPWGVYPVADAAKATSLRSGGGGLLGYAADAGASADAAKATSLRAGDRGLVGYVEDAGASTDAAKATSLRSVDGGLVGYSEDAGASADAAKATSLRSGVGAPRHDEGGSLLDTRGLKARARDRSGDLAFAHEGRGLKARATGELSRSSGRDSLRVLFVGAVGLRKGVPYLLEAWRGLDARATLRLVGPVDAAFLRAIGGLPAGVECVGVKTGDALAEEFRAADVFVLPSVEDGFGVVTTEAMAAGLPAIVSANCGSADAVRDGQNGFVVPACDAAALRDRLELLLSDDELLLRMGVNAAASVQGWSWEESGGAHVREIYEPLLRINRQQEMSLARSA